MSSKRAARDSSQYEQYDPRLHKDAIALATAATAMAGALEEQARSPESNSKDGQNVRDMYSLEDAPQEQQLPSSPMVTPPARSYGGRGKKPAAVATVSVPTAGVPHVYRDLSQISDDFDYTRKKTGGVTQPFPEKLHEMLQAVGDSDIVSWLPHGRAFIVRKPRDFTEQIMPKHGFAPACIVYVETNESADISNRPSLRVSNVNSIYMVFEDSLMAPMPALITTEMFLRARPALCQRMARQKVKGTGHKQPSDAKTEPNFYLMRPVDPMPTHNFCDSSTADAYNQEFRLPPPQAGVATAASAPTFRGMNLTVPDSPASPGMHGAAHLLHGMASGYKNLKIPSAAAMDSNAGKEEGKGNEEGSSDERRASFLQPRLSSPSFKGR